VNYFALIDEFYHCKLIYIGRLMVVEQTLNKDVFFKIFNFSFGVKFFSFMFASYRSFSRVVRQSSAKASTPVRIW